MKHMSIIWAAPCTPKALSNSMPSSLLVLYWEIRIQSVTGKKPHSVSFPYAERLSSSKLALDCANEARSAVLSFFQAPSDYTVVFTANATASLKLIGESYPFGGGSTYVLAADSHNSVRKDFGQSPRFPNLKLFLFRSTASGNSRIIGAHDTHTSPQLLQAVLI